MDIRVLRSFLAIAREGGITKAANFLHVTQPTLSRQIQDLEAELDARLFERHSHSVTLTPAGERLRIRAEEILELVGQTEAEFAARSRTISGDVYVGCGETPVMRHLIDAMNALRTRYSGIHFQIYSGNFEAVTTRLDRGLLDFGVLLQPADLSKYRFVDLPGQDVWGVLTRADSALAHKKSVVPGDLRQEPLILSQQVLRQTGTPNHIAGWFGDDFSRLDVVAIYNLAYNATLMAESGMGHVLMLKGLVNAPERRNLRFVPLNPPLSTGLSVVWKKQQSFSPAAQAFLEEIQARFAASSTQGSSHAFNA
ncbi:MAG: LysR family transcriptional regulator [Deltaproteobacteria bacterium]|nr:LysR family transcriptional regulator [Deltaproteobacteria bacterium]MBQ6669828.1 LysR family transcriptional regulator [Deltaproteobacteria bacterium]